MNLGEELGRVKWRSWTHRSGVNHPKARFSDDEVLRAVTLYHRWRQEDAGLPRNQRRGYFTLGQRLGVGASTIRDWVKGRCRT